ncbi:MAG: dihydroneopterin aldolase [Actinomycetota bacterium]|nr:dihydroneopterin aldolase [Actinomycetota bacterium]
MSALDRIELKGLRAFGYHGVLDVERRHGQSFVVDLELEVDLSQPARSDALGDTVDYGALAQQVSGIIASTRFQLIEALAGHLAEQVLTDARVAAVTVRVAKPQAPLTVTVGEVAVVVRRERRPS